VSALLLAATSVRAPAVEWDALLPMLVLAGGALVTLLASLIAGRAAQRLLAPLLAVLTLVAAAVLFALAIGEPQRAVLSGAISVDDLTCVFSLIFIVGALAAVGMAWRSETIGDFGRGEFFTLLISVVLGMSLLAAAENLVTAFLAFELFSIPLYVLCAADLRREGSLEAGLKYLIIGSLGSATLLFGMALIYGATGATDFTAIGRALAKGSLADDALPLAGIALIFAGIAFKASIAPFHQWTPDVYQGAPTPVTAFMAVATKAAAFALLLRFCALAIAPAAEHWQAPLAALALATIVIGNVGAIGQDSLKRMLGYSGVAQAGYLLAGVVVLDDAGTRATTYYMLAYLLMNIAPFAVITARERLGAGEGYESLSGLGRSAPQLAWPMTISMLALSGLPVTVGFIGKIFLILAAVGGDFAWLGVAIVLGSAVSLVYYLRVIATIWMGDDVAQPGEVQRELTLIAVLAAAAVVLFGFWPDPLLDLAREAGSALFALAR
jgi:NADH-quinone oxidoreductase subunit N